MRRRRTARLRLTLWYGGLVFATGVCLLLLNFFLVERSLTSDAEHLRTAVQRRVAQQAVVEPSAGQPFQGFLRDLNQLSGPMFTTAQASLVKEALSRLMLQSALALPVVTLFSLGVGWVMAGRTLRPLSEITATAQRLSEANLHERIRLAGPDDELKELADTFDAMLARLDAAFSAQRDFVANASHELRTPLAIIRTELEVTLSDPHATADDLRAMAGTVRAATLRSEQLVNSLLTLARTERPAQARDQVDLQRVAQAALDAASASAQLAELQLTADLRPASVVGDRALIERLVENLVENATRHNLPAGWVRLATGMRAGMSLLQVSNSGQSLTPEQMEQLFERFTRLDRSRTRSTGGFGLGMPIVKAVAAAHGGTVEARPLDGGGLAVTVLLPSAPQATPARSFAVPSVPRPADG